MALSALITFIVVMVLLGLAIYLIETYVPMPAPFKLVIRVVVVIFIVLYLLSILGVYKASAQTLHPCDTPSPINTYEVRRNQPIRIAFCHSQLDDDDIPIPIGQLHAYMVNTDNNNAVLRDLGLMIPVGGPNAAGLFYFESPQFTVPRDVHLDIVVEFNGLQAISGAPVFVDVKGGPKPALALRILTQ